jgi:4,5-DOPA dioxygenase extradiol
MTELPTSSSIFLSHGVSLLAADDTWPTTVELKKALAPVGRAASSIVIVSAHWQTDTFSITADHELPTVDEGLPTEILQAVGPFVGSPKLSENLATRLQTHGLSSRLVRGRGLDHGATIRFLDPNPTTPIIQISLCKNDDPSVHIALGRALRSSGSLIVCSGGAVHNLSTLKRFATPETAPPEWAKKFHNSFRLAFTNDQPDIALRSLMDEPDFHLAHPTAEHFLPALVNAGHGGAPTLLHHGWQWSSLATTTYNRTS